MNRSIGLAATVAGLMLASCAGAPKRLDAESARQALVKCVEGYAWAFASPGRAERADELRNVEVDSNDRGVVAIGLFTVDLEKRTYQLTHFYGEPGGGWFEDWTWNGTFRLSADGKWEASEPEFLKTWGQ